MKSVCGVGRSCELICPARKPGETCELSFLDFAELLDAGLDVAPEFGEVLVPVDIV